jgi:hypothetical protein
MMGSGIGDRGSAVTNLAGKIGRRILSVRKPFIRAGRRAGHLQDYVAARRAERAIEQEIAAVAEGDEPIVLGPWLSEVGYEVLYWIPFLRWFEKTYRVRPERVVAVSRGGVGSWYAPLAGRYVDLFDEFSPEEFARRNEERRAETERGGQKQSAQGGFDADILERVKARIGAGAVRVCHPALMFRLFKHFWLGNQPFDFLERRTTYGLMDVPASNLNLPAEYTAVKFYSGMALPASEASQRAVREIVAALARTRPVVLLNTGMAFDDHRDYGVVDLPNVINLEAAMTPSTNLGIQAQVIAGAAQFAGTCGSLAWLAPMLGVPTLALYADDRLLTTHLTVARKVFRAIGAAPFVTADVRALGRLDLAPGGPESPPRRSSTRVA